MFDSFWLFMALALAVGSGSESFWLFLALG
jgi:hypothetical protein